MTTYEKLLVVLDPEDKSHKSLQRAIYIANRTGAHITVLLVLYDLVLDFISSLSSKYRQIVITNIIKEKEQWLSEQLIPFRQQDRVIHTTICWDKHPHQAIIEQVNHFQHDLVIKKATLHSELISMLITPTDWHLLRECPCPVLLVKAHEWGIGSHILSAVNTESQKPEHLDFNNKILEESQHIAELIDADIHLLNCYPGEDINMYITPPKEGHKIDNEHIKHEHFSSIHQMIKQYHIAKDKVHIREGLPDDSIPQVAKDIDAELVILGTGGRSGLSETFLGHTAEQVIDQLSCDLLALKPNNFQPSHHWFH